jgi:hypothetical protein
MIVLLYSQDSISQITDRRWTMVLETVAQLGHDDDGSDISV